MHTTNVTTKYDLPPNVHGKERGILTLTILDIVPKSPSSVSSGASSAISSNSSLRGRNPMSFIGSGGVAVKFTWWGQSHENSAVVNYNPTPRPSKAHIENNSPSIRYSIKTRPSLFQNYLSNCESVEIKLTSNTSNLQIGTAFMKIANSFVEDCTKEGSAEVTQTLKIFNPRNIPLGDIRLKLNMAFCIKPANTNTPCIPPEPKTVTVGKDNELHISGLESIRSCKSIKSDINLCISQLRQKCYRPPTAQSTTNSLSSRAMDYLTGREMSEADENKALEEIQTTSPLESLVAQLTNRLKCPVRDIYNRIDSLRLAVKSITILAAGLRELDYPQLDGMSFTVESHISPNLLGNVRAKYDYDVMRFYSDHVDAKEKRIDFNRDAIRSIRITEYVDNAYIRFTIWTRPFGSKYSRCFGTAKFQFATLLETGDLEQIRKLAVKSCTDKTCVGYAVVKVTLGSKGVHFGEDFMTIVQNTESSDSPPSTHRSRKCIHYCCSKDPEINFTRPASTRCRTCNNNETNKLPNTSHSAVENHSTTQRPPSSKHGSSALGSRRDQSSEQSPAKQPDSTGDEREKHTLETTERQDSLNNKRLLQGLVYVGSIRNVRELQNGGYFLVCRAFWKEDATSTDFCQDYNFNFLEIFPVINNETFLERSRNNHLDLELWQKFADTPEQLVGIVKLPLHQFFIAFRDNVITSHLCQAKLPVISIDGWVTITSPLSAETCGQMQALLAIGTEEQLEYLKASRGLCLNRVCDSNLIDSTQIKIPVPQMMPGTKANERSLSSCDAESQTNFSEGGNQDCTEDTSARRDRLSDLLGNFIDSLAQKLPPSSAPIEPNAPPTKSEANQKNQSAQGSQLRKTSDLLDVLQKALVTPPNIEGMANASLTPGILKPSTSLLPSYTLPQRFVKILLEIENALHLPRNPVKIGNKKLLKRNSSAAKCKQSRLPADEEPSAYVTFQAEEGCGQMIKSHEGMVYATNVVEKNCNPAWNRRYEVQVPADLMKNDEKRFILKVWRKRVTDLPQCRLLPAPLEDAIIGFAAVDLNVLLAGMPCIAGWFNIVDFNGRVNGQIKVNARPLEDVSKIKDSPLTSFLSKSSLVADPNISQSMLKCAQPAPAANVDMNNSMLSRAIKRKFTELEEITERLRARLLDVTGTPEVPITINTDGLPGVSATIDPIDDQLDEFERDLNTACDEDNNDGRLDNFGWLGMARTLATSGQQYGEEIDDDVSDCSTNESQERIQMISECLRKTDLNNENDIPTTSAAVHRREHRNPPEGETASILDKTHVD